MIYIKTYETFLSKLSQYWNVIKPKNIDKNLIVADWNDNQIAQLNSFGFEQKSINVMEYNSPMNDFLISITKYWDEYAPGYAPSLFKTCVVSGKLENGVPKETNKNYSEFEDLIKFLENTISEEELNANKYNL